ncbi:Uncharacterised protein [Mycobacteroides abscessus subsp. abscessus]|nr:Uncharacterised protein [Mycobacteroides abscessus subsp. abscessus]
MICSIWSRYTSTDRCENGGSLGIGPPPLCPGYVGANTSYPASASCSATVSHTDCDSMNGCSSRTGSPSPISMGARRFDGFDKMASSMQSS